MGGGKGEANIYIFAVLFRSVLRYGCQTKPPHEDGRGIRLEDALQAMQALEGNKKTDGTNWTVHTSDGAASEWWGWLGIRCWEMVDRVRKQNLLWWWVSVWGGGGVLVGGGDSS